MNCKPGDLAVIVRSEGSGIAGEISRKIVGNIVKVTHLRKAESVFCPCDEVWNFLEVIKVSVNGINYLATGIGDHCLRPIRDPGEDAQDESLNWLPSPNKEIA